MTLRKGLEGKLVPLKFCATSLDTVVWTVIKKTLILRNVANEQLNATRWRTAGG